MTLTFNALRAMVMTYSRAKVQGQQSISSRDTVETNDRKMGKQWMEAIALRHSLMLPVIILIYTPENHHFCCCATTWQKTLSYPQSWSEGCHILNKNTAYFDKEMLYRFTCLVESIVELNSGIPATNSNELIVRVHYDAVEWTPSRHNHSNTHQLR